MRTKLSLLNTRVCSISGYRLKGESEAFVNGLDPYYRVLMIRDVQNESYDDVVNTALHSDSYLDMKKVEQERKKNTSFFG